MSSELEEYTSALKKLKGPHGRPVTSIWPSEAEDFSRKTNTSQFQHPPLEDLVHHQVSESEVQAFNVDTKNTGYTLPGTNYEGPGNSVNRGLPRGHADTVAEKHDAQYFDLEYRYGHGDISQKIFEDEISNSDREAIREFNSGNTFGDVLGKDGLTIKHGVEKVTGQIYPSTGNYGNW